MTKEIGRTENKARYEKCVEEAIEPEEDYNEEDDEDWIREYGNTDEVDDYSEEYE